MESTQPVLIIRDDWDAADITALYLAEFGEVPVRKRLFVRASTMVDGFESLVYRFQARVPASA